MVKENLFRKVKEVVGGAFRPMNRTEKEVVQGVAAQDFLRIIKKVDDMSEGDIDLKITKLTSEGVDEATILNDLKNLQNSASEEANNWGKKVMNTLNALTGRKRKLALLMFAAFTLSAVSAEAETTASNFQQKDDAKMTWHMGDHDYSANAGAFNPYGGDGDPDNGDPEKKTKKKSRSDGPTLQNPGEVQQSHPHVGKSRPGDNDHRLSGLDKAPALDPNGGEQDSRPEAKFVDTEESGGGTRNMMGEGPTSNRDGDKTAWLTLGGGGASNIEEFKSQLAHTNRRDLDNNTNLEETDTEYGGLPKGRMFELTAAEEAELDGIAQDLTIENFSNDRTNAYHFFKNAGVFEGDEELFSKFVQQGGANYLKYLGEKYLNSDYAKEHNILSPLEGEARLNAFKEVGKGNITESTVHGFDMQRYDTKTVVVPSKEEWLKARIEANPGGIEFYPGDGKPYKLKHKEHPGDKNPIDPSYKPNPGSVATETVKTRVNLEDVN